MITFPSLPFVRQLVLAEPEWFYPSSAGAGGGVASLRVWAAQPGHVALVTELGIGASTTTAAGEIWTTLAAEFEGPLVVLEHYPPGQSLLDSGDSLAQVVMASDQPHWRAIWPVPLDNPAHTEFDAWMRAYGFDLLASTQ